MINSELIPAQSFAKSLLCFRSVYFSSGTFKGLFLGSSQLSACVRSAERGGEALLQGEVGGTSEGNYSVSVRLYINPLAKIF